MTNVKEILDKYYNGRILDKGQDYVISCLNPEHADNNPSLRVDKQTGVYNCFSCGFNGSIYKFYDIFSNRNNQRVHNLINLLDNLKSSFIGLSIPDNSVPWNKNFRDISSKTFKYFKAFTSTSEDFKNRIIFPISDITGKIDFFVSRHLESDLGAKYKVYPRHVETYPFPQVFTESTNSIVLVEGIFDMLNLYDKGLYNSVCAFGVTTINRRTISKLDIYKILGIDKIYILFDGDQPGIKAAKILLPILEDAGFIVEIIELDEDSDPGSMSYEDVQKLKRYISE